MTDAAIWERLRKLGYGLGESRFEGLHVVTSPDGGYYGHMTAEEAAERFLAEKEKSYVR